MMLVESVYNEFLTEGELVSIAPYGNGHINDTYLAKVSGNGKEKLYVLQKMNTNVFKFPDILMKNYVAVSKYLSEKVKSLGGDAERECVNIVKTKDGEDWLKTDDGECWRMLWFITGSKCYDKVESPEQFYDCAVAFGHFQAMLSEFPIGELEETIKDFHNTKDRFEKFLEAVEADKCKRLESCRAEVDFIMARREFCSYFESEHEAGRLPYRVTHNDTKLNNILFDAQTNKPICIIDLDTVMPGYAVNDFGDSIRFGANTAAEDERDLSLVNFDLELYELYAKGFIEGVNGALLPSEIALLPASAKMMTLECGMRFLTDYLSGDTYFKIHRDGHNLDRARTQLKLVSEMEKNFDKMVEIVNKYANA